MPNDAGRHLVAFALGMRCFTCLGTSENPTRHLPAAVSSAEARVFSNCCLGGCPGLYKRLFWLQTWVFSRGEKGCRAPRVKQSLTRNTHCPKLPPGHHPRSPGWAAAHRAVTTSHPLLQHRLRVSLIVSEEEFSTASILFALLLHTSAQICSFLLYLHAQGPLLLAGQRRQ